MATTRPLLALLCLWSAAVVCSLRPPPRSQLAPTVRAVGAVRGGAVAQPEVSAGAQAPAYYMFAAIVVHKMTVDTPSMPAAFAALGALAVAHAAFAVVTHWSALCAACSSRWRALRGRGDD